MHAMRTVSYSHAIKVVNSTDAMYRQELPVASSVGLSPRSLQRKLSSRQELSPSLDERQRTCWIISSLTTLVCLSRQALKIVIGRWTTNLNYQNSQQSGVQAC